MSVAPPRHPRSSLPNGIATGSSQVPSGSSAATASAASSIEHRNDLVSGPNSRSFLNLTSSALSGVFGSQTSLADLAGDTTSYARTNGRVNQSSTNIDNVGSFLDEASISLTGSLNDDGIKRRRTSMSFPSSAVSSARKQRSGIPRLPSLSSSTGSVRLSLPTLMVRLVTLFACGVAYGELARNLHDNHLVTIHTLDIATSQNSVTFSLVFGAQGILLGFLTPLFDWLFPISSSERTSKGKGGTDWSSIIRAVAAFLGLSYGVRKLPWESSMQAAALWGLVNPFLWYILDGTRNGFILSSITAIAGTSVFAILFPSHLPDPALTSEYIAVTVWVASTLYICSICFGNIGRRILSFDVSSTV